MEISNPLSSSLKCPTCRINFTIDEQHKKHYKSDFHRYNLKRSMVNLLPATFEQFSTKRSEVRNQRQSTFQCGQCRKVFSSSQTLNQHGDSKKHKINMIQEQRSKVQKQAKPKVHIKNERLCLFCAKEFQSIENSLKHMSIEHSFFVPQQNYCSDKSKLIIYLQEKIQVGMMCIFCDNKGCKDFATGQAVRKHMLTKNHTFMNTQNGYEEYENFYDFSELFRQKLEQQKSYAAPLGIKFEKVKVIVDQKLAKQAKAKPRVNQENEKDENDDDQFVDAESEDQQWQDESQSQDENTIKQQNAEQEQLRQKIRRKVKAYQIMVPTMTSGDQLLLPNGKILGHRKYRHIYKQVIKFNNWFQVNKLNMIESNGHQEALALKNNILDLVKKQNILKTHLRNQGKKYVQSGIQNSNLFRHFRSSNPK